MENMQDILKNYRFTDFDEKNLPKLAEILLPASDQLAEDFFTFLMENPHTAGYFRTDAAVAKRKANTKVWFRVILTSRYDHHLLMRLQRIGAAHVKIGLPGHYVNAGMNFIRTFCLRHLESEVRDEIQRRDLAETMEKVLDISLDIMTSSYREAELKKVFLSHRVEFYLVRWAERALHGLNLVLMLGLVLMALGVTGLLISDIVFALRESLETGMIKALGSLLILWMMVELLHTQVEHLRGGHFHVLVFVELALVAFIRKLFVASIDEKDAITFGLMIGGLMVLGVIYFLVGRVEPRSRP